MLDLSKNTITLIGSKISSIVKIITLKKPKGQVLSCCLLLILFNPLLSLERTFAEQVYFVKSFFKDSSTNQIKPAKKYTIALVGDSMTLSLSGGEEIQKSLTKYYPNKEFSILNYSIGSTNLLSVPDRLTKGSVRGTETLFPVLSNNFNVIILESFGNNPLSDYSLENGLKKQTETLDEIIKTIKSIKPEAVVIFLATIAPSHRYAEGIVNLSPEQRKIWVEERSSYIKNHIEYAKSHHLFLINVYEKTLLKNGDGNLDFIAGDFIHPSDTGVQFISQEIADFLFKKRILPL